jgi:hypothetical protein
MYRLSLSNFIFPTFLLSSILGACSSQGNYQPNPNNHPTQYTYRNISATASAYAGGCGQTEQCQTNIDTQYLGIPAGCVEISRQIIRGSVFGTASAPMISYLPSGSQVNESEYQQMSSSSGLNASVSAGEYGTYGGKYNSSFASNTGRAGTFVTNIDIIRMQVEATGQHAFWRGPGSRSEYTLRVNLRCTVN